MNCVVVNIIGNGERYSSIRALNEFDVFIRDTKVLNIINKVQSFKEVTMDTIVFSRNPFGFSSTYEFKQLKPFTESIKIMTSKGNFYVPQKDITTNREVVGEWKVVISKTSAEHAGQADKDGRKKVLSRVEILGEKQICSESYLLIGHFGEKSMAQNLQTYIKTKLCRFLLSSVLLTQNIAKDKFQFVPLQDFSESWTDEKLYAKYNLSPEEIAYIEGLIKPMD